MTISFRILSNLSNFFKSFNWAPKGLLSCYNPFHVLLSKKELYLLNTFTTTKDLKKGTILPKEEFINSIIAVLDGTLELQGFKNSNYRLQVKKGDVLFEDALCSSFPVDALSLSSLFQNLEAKTNCRLAFICEGDSQKLQRNAALAGSLRLLNRLQYLSSTNNLLGVSNLSKEHEILLASLLRFQSYKAGDFIYKENEFSTGLFVLVRGCVGIYKEGSDKSQKLICKFLPGTYFGELSLLTSYIPRTSSAISIEPSVVLKLEGTDFLKFLKLCPEARQAWRESFQKNVIVRITAQLERFNAPFLRGFTREDYESLAQVTQLEYFAPHYEVVKENTDATKFYMIAFGEVNVFVNNEKVGEMGEGHYFGEIGLLHESKRTATVRTKTPCVMLTCNKYNFSKLFARNPLLEAEFRSRLDPYSLSVENIIYHPKALKCFMEFLKEEFSAENLSFVIDVLDFKAGGVGSAKELIEKYFKGDALNLSDQCRMGTLKAYKQVTGKEDCLELFDEALKEVMLLIGTDSLNRFKSSPLFTRFLTTLQTYTILGGGPSTRRGRFNYDSFGKKSALLGRGTNIRPREHIPTQLANTAIKDERTALSSVGSEIPRVTDRRSVDLQFMEFDSTPSFTSQLS